MFSKVVFTIFHSHQRCMEALIPPYLLQDLVWLVFKILAILIGVW